MIKPIEINNRLIDLITTQLAAMTMKIAYKKGFVQFYLPTLFGKVKDYDALITLAPKQDKASYHIGKTTSKPYRIVIGIVKRIDTDDPEVAVDELQILLHEVRSALNSNHDDDQPLADLIGHYTVAEAFPAEFSMPDSGIPAVSCFMTLDFIYDQSTK